MSNNRIVNLSIRLLDVYTELVTASTDVASQVRISLNLQVQPAHIFVLL